MAQTKAPLRPPLIVFLGLEMMVCVSATSSAAAQEQSLAATDPKVHLSEWGAAVPNDRRAMEPISPPAISNDRLFFALPNFMTVESTQKLEPLTVQEKFKLVMRSTFDPVEFPLYGLRAGIIQAQNRPSSYGQGLSGYGQRYALTFADCTVENFMAGAVFPALLHEDPRYYRMAHGPKKRRLAYAASRVFITRADSGGERFNYPEILGSGVAASISTYSYHPPEDRRPGGVASTWGSQIAFHMFTLVMREFWPDIRREVFHAP